MAKKTTAKGGNKSNKKTAVDAGFASDVKKLAGLLDEVKKTMKGMGLVSLTSEERVHSNGRLRDGEQAAMTCVFDAMDTFPQFFGTVAAKDGGNDPKSVETVPARLSLARALALAPIVTEIDALLSWASDDVMFSVQTAKDVSVGGYAAGKFFATEDAKLRAAMTTAIDFYGSAARQRSLKLTKAANAAKKASKKAGASAP